MMRWGVIALCALLLLPGCSLLLVRDAPDHLEPGAPRECTSTRVWPVADTAVAVLATVGAFYLLTRSDDSLDRLGAGIEGALALGFGYSAWRGWRETGQCRTLRAGG